MAISMTKWVAMADAERLKYVRSGVLKVEPIFGIYANAKVGYNEPHKEGVVKYKATSRSIQLAIADSEELAYQDAYKFLSTYTGELPKPNKEPDHEAIN